DHGQGKRQPERFYVGQQTLVSLPAVPRLHMSGIWYRPCLTHWLSTSRSVVMLNWAKPRRPATSMDLTTNSWRVRASAVLINGREVSPSAGSPTPRSRVSRRLFTSALSLRIY